MKKLLVAVLLSLVTIPVLAEDVALIVGIGCRHISSESHYFLNETNPSIGVEVFDIKAVYVSKNSWNEKSLYMTYSPDYELNEYVSVSADIGFATGYKPTNTMERDGRIFYNDVALNDIGVMPLVAATIDYKPTGEDFAISLSVNPYVAMLSVKFEL